MGSNLRTALGFFTIAPIRHRGLDRDNAGPVMLLAPLVGTLIVAVAGLCVLLARFLADPNGRLSWTAAFGHAAGANLPYDAGPIPAVIGIAVIALLNRGLHLDGLADTADALGSYRDQATALEIMRKPDLGPLGMVTVVFFLMVDVAALRVCITNHHGTTALFTAVVTGRLAMTLACTPRTPAARPEGLGALVAGQVSRLSAAAVALAVIAAAGLTGLADPHTLNRWSEVTHAMAAVFLGAAVAHAFRAHCVRRFGGITGDVLGALNEVATMVALLVMAVSV